MLHVSLIQYLTLMYVLQYLKPADWTKKQNESKFGVWGKEGWGTLQDCTLIFPPNCPAVPQERCWPTLSPTQVINATSLQTKVASGGRGAGRSTTRAKGVYIYMANVRAEKEKVVCCFVGHHSVSGDTQWAGKEKNKRHIHINVWMNLEWDYHSLIVL